MTATQRPPPTTNSPGGKENGSKRGNVEWTTVGGTNRLRWRTAGVCSMQITRQLTGASLPSFSRERK